MTQTVKSDLMMRDNDNAAFQGGIMDARPEKLSIKWADGTSHILQTE